MPRKKRSASPFELIDDDFDEDASSQSSRNGNPPMRNAANARERARMRVLSSAFGRLKTKLPNIPADTKLSKLDTLRLATMYIKQLKTVVEGGCGALSPSNTASLDDRLNGSTILNDNCFLNLNSATQSMSWPFGFHHQMQSSLTRLTTNSSVDNNSLSTPSWCQLDGNNSKQEQDQQQRYNTENYDQQQQHHHETTKEHSSTTNTYLTATSSLQTPLLNGQNHEPTWYSETPSPDLSNSPPLGISYDNTSLNHHHHHYQQQQRNSLMEHLSLIQLSTPPPSSSSTATAATTHSLAQQHPIQNHSHHQNYNSSHQHSHASNNSLHHHHHHLSSQQFQQHLQHHHHLPSGHHLQQSFANATNFTTTSIR